jgi:HlyD family secretion protein
MDIPRTPPNRTRRRIILAGGGIAVLVLVSVGLARLEPAAPEVERATLYIDSVTRGPFVREVRGPGTLVPEQIRWVTTSTEGRVEKINLLPGIEVGPDTVILELSNPELEQALQDAELALAAAEAQYTNLVVEVANGILSQEAEAARLSAEFEEAQPRCFSPTRSRPTPSPTSTSRSRAASS